jgi:hypothetical protein
VVDSRPLRRALSGGLLAAALAAVGCLSPTLPIPPPATPELTAPDAEGLVKVSGGAQSVRPYARVMVENYTAATRCPTLSTSCATPTVVGGDAASDGSYAVLINAQHGDLILVTEQVGSETSDSASAYVP